MGSDSPEKELRKLLVASEKARAQGETALASYLIAEAAQTLTDCGRVREAIELYVLAHEYAPAAELYEKHGDFEQAARHWFRAGNLVKAAEARLRTGEADVAAELFVQAREYAKAAELFEQRRDLRKAAALYERAGDEERAAMMLFGLLMQPGTDARRGEGLELCRRTGLMFARIGRMADAVRVLRSGEQLAHAGQALVGEGRHEEAIQLLESGGHLSLAAELCRNLGLDRRAHVLLAKQAENEGRMGDAGLLYAQAGEDDSAARCYAKSAELEERAFESAGGLVGSIVADQLYHAATRLVALARDGELSRYDEAIDLLLQIGPGHADFRRARALLAELYVEIGEPDRARSALQDLDAD